MGAPKVMEAPRPRVAWSTLLRQPVYFPDLGQKMHLSVSISRNVTAWQPVHTWNQSFEKQRHHI
jgi:hypothetical protein